MSIENALDIIGPNLSWRLNTQKQMWPYAFPHFRLGNDQPAWHRYPSRPEAKRVKIGYRQWLVARATAYFQTYWEVDDGSQIGASIDTGSDSHNKKSIYVQVSQYVTYLRNIIYIAFMHRSTILKKHLVGDCQPQVVCTDQQVDKLLNFHRGMRRSQRASLKHWLLTWEKWTLDFGWLLVITYYQYHVWASLLENQVRDIAMRLSAGKIVLRVPKDSW